MKVVVTLFLAIAATLIVYAWLGQGGGVSGLTFFGILLIGGIIATYGPKTGSSS